ncbi:MAG: FGGY family carbohydrate kinase [Balneolaceae bacterium]
MRQTKFLLGYDIGSSSIKASLLETDTGKEAGASISPKKEMGMISVQSGWAEQEPEDWWNHLKIATKELLAESGATPEDIGAIGISYQMHGLVAVDKQQQVVRPSIIWCDSRASEIGNKAFREIGPEACLKQFLNSPGNFTASKLKWVQENEPEVYSRIDKMMLPGDYIAMKLSGTVSTTVSGLSEGILWDFQSDSLAGKLLEYYGISEDLIPKALPSFAIHGEVTKEAAREVGLKEGTKIAYKAGDQPNNAFSLNVLHPGEVAATAGTSGVVYGISDEPEYDEKSRVNTFVHVNHSAKQSRYGVLLCVNGTGILNSWLKQNLGLGNELTYDEMNHIASSVPIGSDGVTILPFGNGAERILENRDLGAQIVDLRFNRHQTAHLFRAAQEGIVFALHYGFQIMGQMGMKMQTVKAGHANMFFSPIFREAFVNTTGATLELYNTDGALGAARGAGVGSGIYKKHEEAFETLSLIESIEPDTYKQTQYNEAYQRWVEKLQSQ